MAPDETSSLYEKMGEVSYELRALGKTLHTRHDKVDRLHDLLRKDVNALGLDQKDLSEKLDCVICVMQHDLEDLRVNALAGMRSVSQLIEAVQELRRPVAEIVALRSWAAGLILGLGILGSAVVWLAEPIYRWFVMHSYLKQ